MYIISEILFKLKNLLSVCQNIVASPVFWNRQSHYCCYGNCAAGSQPIWKLFNISLRMKKVSLYQN